MARGRAVAGASVPLPADLSPFLRRLEYFRQRHCPDTVTADELVRAYSAEYGGGNLDAAASSGEDFFLWLRHRFSVELPEYYDVVRGALVVFYTNINKRKAVGTVPVLLEQYATPLDNLMLLEQHFQERYGGNQFGVPVPPLYRLALDELDRIQKLRIDVFSDS